MKWTFNTFLPQNCLILLVFLCPFAVDGILHLAYHTNVQRAVARQREKANTMRDLASEEDLPPLSNAERRAQQTQEERIASTIHLAGEALANVPQERPDAFATPEREPGTPFLTEFEFLTEAVAQFRQALAANPQLTEFLRQLPQGFADGEILQILFCNLFPEQKGKRRMYADEKGRLKLNAKQRAVLRDAAVGLDYKGIAEKHGYNHRQATNIISGIRRKLDAGTLQEAVATAISMGYLDLDVMDFVNAAGRCAPQDYSTLDSMVSYLDSVKYVDNPTPWEELAAFGLFLMLASGMAANCLYVGRRTPKASGVLYRLKREDNGTFQATRIVGAGLLRAPCGVAVAPLHALNAGFQPGNLFVIHHSPFGTGMNKGEIVEIAPNGSVIRTFCGGRTQRTSLSGGRGLTFEPSGSLLVTNGASLLRFTKNGKRVRRLTDACSLDVCTNAAGDLYVARYSSRGGSLDQHTPRGKLLQRLKQLHAGEHFASVRLATNGDIVALYRNGSGSEVAVHRPDGHRRRSWEVPGAADGIIALEAQTQRVYVPCSESRCIRVYTLDGTEQVAIQFNGEVVPQALAFDNEGNLWFVGFASDA